ncbi:hypothetical protein EON67_07900 [archaeon]|nr:MAG: hypothetical protein EON67_07900 [archaeon]
MRRAAMQEAFVVDVAKRLERAAFAADGAYATAAANMSRLAARGMTRTLEMCAPGEERSEAQSVAELLRSVASVKEEYAAATRTLQAECATLLAALRHALAVQGDDVYAPAAPDAADAHSTRDVRGVA